jgi:hypothetical protein
MPKTRPVGDLEIGEDLQFQHRQWRVQRIGWVVMAVIALLAIAGLMGPGPLSRATATTADGRLLVRYQRFARYQAPATLQFEFSIGASRNTRLWLSRKYMEGVQVGAITPAPESVSTARDWLGYVFPLNEPGERLVVKFSVEMEQFGRQELRVRLEDGQSVVVKQFVFP